MSKEKVALLQKTFSLWARASIDDYPIKNGSYTVFENNKKVSFNIASYVYILSGQKLTKNAKNSQFGEFLEI